MNNYDLLKDLKQKLEKEIDISINKIILFGSRTNGNSEEFSDYDILIILNDEYNWITENKIYDSAYDIMLKEDLIFDIKIINQNEINTDRGRQPFIKNALQSKVYA
ncbi:MAG TPA: nucleotidyltransferase domain-containing protein [Spirochaetota bacterium]|nr:nucleotidyltransferase domain-containing protein [Spirochaetota bacterium]HQB60148.1 nucleotidyltransferase domain-containing protein [Spirochaetota bacterium]